MDKQTLTFGKRFGRLEERSGEVVGMVKRARPEATWETYGEAFSLFLRGATFATAARLALVVGTWLSLMNQGRAIVDGNAPWVKVALNFLTPFVVASLGYLAARRRRNVERLAAHLGHSLGSDGGVEQSHLLARLSPACHQAEPNKKRGAPWPGR